MKTWDECAYEYDAFVRGFEIAGLLCSAKKDDDLRSISHCLIVIKTDGNIFSLHIFDIYFPPADNFIEFVDVCAYAITRYYYLSHKFAKKSCHSGDFTTVSVSTKHNFVLAFCSKSDFRLSKPSSL